MTRTTGGSVARSRQVPGLVVAALLLLASCGDDGDDGDDAEQGDLDPGQTLALPDDADGTDAEGTATTSATEPPAGNRKTLVGFGEAEPPAEVKLTEIAEVDQPTALAVHPDTGDLYVAEKVTGRVRRIDGETLDLDREPVVEIEVADGYEQGLLGLAIDPSGDHLYVSYTNRQGDSRIDEFTFEDGRVDPGSRRVVLQQDQPFANHNGGGIAFGPDGYLYIAFGDGGGQADPSGTGQNPDDFLASILRIDPSEVTGGRAYGIPGDNPFVDGGGAPEVWLYGSRNPWRFTFDRDTGDLWVGDVGGGQFEEVDLLSADSGGGKGANLGWSEMEAHVAHEGGRLGGGMTPPIFAYPLGDGTCAIVGGYVYRGDEIPGLSGTYVYGDNCQAEVRFLQVGDGGAVAEGELGVSVPKASLSSFGEGLDGELYVLSLDGGVFRIDPA
jgi:glucose/arabinose dehydrogenase